MGAARGKLRGATAALGCALALAVPATAGATTYFEGFDADDDGWDILQRADPKNQILTPDYSPVGGNPGGFIRYTDGESGIDDQEAWFVSPFAAENTDGEAVMGFDLRTNATGLRTNGVGAIVFNQEASVVCVLGPPANGGWTNYTVTYSADEPCWRDVADNDADESDMQGAIAFSDAQILVFADLGTGAGEETDLDNVAWIAAQDVNDRDLSIRYKGRTGKFSGRITEGGEFCEDAEQVELYMQRSGDDKLIGADETSFRGKWVVGRQAKKGKRYYARALPSAQGGDGCREVVSETIKG